LDYEPHSIGNASSWGARCGIRSGALDRAAAALFAARFRRVTERSTPVLSTDSVQDDRIDRLQGALAEMRSDVGAGRYAIG